MVEVEETYLPRLAPEPGLLDFIQFVNSRASELRRYSSVG